MQIKKIILLFILSLCVPVAAQAQLIDYDMEDSVLFTWTLSNLQNNKSTVWFLYGWNNFWWLVFLRTAENLSIPETVQLWISTKTCYKKLRGVYYNNQRGMRFRPLDQDTLTILQTLTWAYDSLQITGWLFLGCNGSVDTYIYGNITHTRSGYKYELIAWIQFQFPLNQYLPTFSQTLRFIPTIDGDTLSGHLRDNYGWIGMIRWSGMCVDVRNPNPNTICSWVPFAQTSNCGNTQNATWTKYCPSGNWWVITISKDQCELPSTLACANVEGTDDSPSYYDNTCCTEYTPPHLSPNDCSLDGSTYSLDLEQGYMYACNLAVTTKTPIIKANVMWQLVRKDLAKMISEFAIRKMWMIPNYQKPGCDWYTDIANESAEMKFYMKTACQLEIMWLHPDGTTPKTVFDPNKKVPRTEFGTVLSRMLFGDTYKIDNSQSKVFYKNHLQALKDKNVMMYTQAPMIFNPETRGFVRLMIKRADDLWLVTERSIIDYIIGWGVDALLNTNVITTTITTDQQ